MIFPPRDAQKNVNLNFWYYVIEAFSCSNLLWNLWNFQAMGAQSTLRRPAASPLKVRQAAVKAAANKRAKEGLPEHGTGEPQEGLPANGPVKVEPQSPAAKGKKPPIPKDAAKRMHSKLQTLAKQGKPELQEAYKNCKSQKEKRDFFYDQYLLDPDVSEKSVLKKDLEENVEVLDTIDDWYTAEEIADMKGIKPAMVNFADLVQASVKGLPVRDHEDENLAALGVKQYHYQAQKSKTQTVKKRQLELTEQVSDVGQEDFTQMRNAMSHKSQRMISNKGQSSGSKGSGQQMALEKDANVKVDWHQAFKEQMKKCKSQVASMGSELHSCELLKKKGEGLPETNEMKALLLKQLTASSKVLEAEKQKCMAEMLKLPKTCTDETEAEAKQQEAADLAAQVQDFLKAWRKEVAVHKKYLEQEIA